MTGIVTYSDLVPTQLKTPESRTRREAGYFADLVLDEIYRIQRSQMPETLWYGSYEIKR